MTDDFPQSATAARLAELIRRTTQRAEEFKATGVKMSALTAQLAAESKAAEKKAMDARADPKKRK